MSKGTQKVAKLLRAEKWEKRLLELEEQGVIRCSLTGGLERGVRVSNPSAEISVPVTLSLLSGAVYQGGKRLSGFGADGVLKAVGVEVG